MFYLLQDDYIWTRKYNSEALTRVSGGYNDLVVGVYKPTYNNALTQKKK